MRQPKKIRRRHVSFRVNPHEKLVVFDIFSRFSLELSIIEKSTGRLEIDFLVPGNIRITKGSLS